MDCGYSLEPPHRRGSNEYPQSMFLSRNVKNIRIFYLKISFFGGKIFSIFEYRHVFVMTTLVAVRSNKMYKGGFETKENIKERVSLLSLHK